ncbi:MAG: hypothetical protein N3B13_09500 [Deltaproteobacteria bacterium]|nr:hypothetical protein [Deltaproteobacteria bacterium]
MKYLYHLICVLNFLVFLSCETYSIKDMEMNNPYPFTIKVLIEENGRKIKFEDTNARMTCDKLPTYDECTPCQETTSDDKCIYDPDSGKSFTADSCMCKGYYHITSQNGLKLIIKDPKKARTPSTFLTQIDADVLYMNIPLQGKIMLTKSEIETTIKQSDNSTVILTDSFFLDIAGGFEATDGVKTLRGGIFYSTTTEK